jgi:hypothetical protein
MTEAERLAHECAVAVLNRNDDVQAVLEYFRQYGRLVQEAAGKKAVDYDPLEAKALSDFGAGERLAASRIAHNINAMDLP